MVAKTPANTNSRKGMSGAVRVGDLIFLAGQIAFDENSDVAVGDIEAQATQCFRNIERELAEFGATLDDLVEVTAFVAHPFNLDAYVRVRTQMFSPTHPPATTSVVAALGSPNWLVEVKAIAAIGPWTENAE
ncbi:RidA family protein [Amycolatopsis sp. GM8]|uniref:RidA family protein n=1 Tax=Amycolatopsis sp. GM8 TaxID=2896530 RepID=UPI001F4517BC|nr:RidA family protein [Amycolatopsis sp. GM8]